MKYLLIDGNNLAIRNAFVNESMQNEDGVASGAHYGFFNSLLGLKHRFPDSQILVAWDSASQRRAQESEIGVQGNVIPELYKENRKQGEKRKPLEDWALTGDHLRKALGTVGIPQIRVMGYEADDVIASYCKLLRDEHEVIVVTSDKDFYQLLHENVKVWDGMKVDFVTEESFREDFGISPKQHVDVGALMGDSGDNIFGIPGWGPKTALVAIQKSGTWQAVLDELEEKHEDLRKRWQDFCDEDRYDNGLDRKPIFEEIQGLKTKAGKPKYPEIYWSQPYSGLLRGIEKKEIKMPKQDLMALMFKDRVELAYSLKKMDDDIEDLPEIQGLSKNRERLLEYFEYYDIVKLVNRVDPLFA